MNDYVMPNSSPMVFSTNYPLWVAIVIAVFVHIAITLEIELPKPEPETLSRDIDVTLISAPTTETPEKAQFLAQENQLASGQQTSKSEPVKQLEKPLEKINPAPPVKPLVKAPEKIKTLPPVKPSPKISEKIKLPPPVKPIAKEPEKIKPLPEVKPIEDRLPPVSKAEIEQKILTQQKAEQKIVIPSSPNTSSRPETHQHLSAAMLQQQIIEEATEESTQRPPSVMQETTIKTVKQVSANKFVAAQYVKDWEAKVIRTADNNYPVAASKPGFSAILTMEVGIKADGSIDSIRITHSSGIPELDNQAKNIVRMSAPFPPLSSKLLSELDVLLITRIWKFSDESGLITQ
jgi:protein TonB